MRGKRSISERPLDVNSRTIPGHWEIDIIVGKGQNSSLIVLVERTTRFTFLILPWDRTSHSFAQAVMPLLASLPDHLRKTLTLDNGSENAQFQAIERMLLLSSLP